MAEASKKRTVFHKLASILTGKPEEEEEKAVPKKRPAQDQGAHAPAAQDPLDLAFVKNFVSSGGKFLYCENKDELRDYLDKIRSETDVTSVFCRNPELSEQLSGARYDVLTEGAALADAFACRSEYLVAFNGGIMITEHQTRGHKLDQLPHTFLTFAYTSQITENLRSALSGIRRRYHGNLPGQITTIKGPQKVKDMQDSQPGQVCNKDIYLLLLEDQV